jgi:hypothetical protein
MKNISPEVEHHTRLGLANIHIETNFTALRAVLTGLSDDDLRICAFALNCAGHELFCADKSSRPIPWQGPWEHCLSRIQAANVIDRLSDAQREWARTYLLTAAAE